MKNQIIMQIQIIALHHWIPMISTWLIIGLGDAENITTSS